MVEEKNIFFKFDTFIQYSTKALNKEKQRTDMLLYQMLPKSIAEMLKRREQVDAEQYNESTIFLSDIVGFTAICAQSSPLQVIDLLGNVYTTFDERIDVHDVYKVETIGDAYMVVSGVPKRNGKRHASEIATMSLDLLRNVKRIEISHLPGIRLKIRIGIHSGPTVAGVIGTKMPRFCLFGETVRIASKMESRGKANRIQISQATRDLLLAIGGFDMEERENDVVRREILNAFPGMTGRTYWLRNVDGLNRRASEHSSSSETEDESCCTETSGALKSYFPN
ncbi:atrial natriuretic peptide receptor 1-like [Mytilus californianus]|uniref:atrial natriuretic peptide receptor 1-like n=1 Tax=Mytilus californianus TaxID=6549 RepID=UPI0022481091|nr:atrial natriuretic peptide receptor 1-like [Mytilus californianus]